MAVLGLGARVGGLCVPWVLGVRRLEVCGAGRSIVSDCGQEACEFQSLGRCLCRGLRCSGHANSSGDVTGDSWQGWGDEPCRTQQVKPASCMWPSSSDTAVGCTQQETLCQTICQVIGRPADETHQRNSWSPCYTAHKSCDSCWPVLAAAAYPSGRSAVPRAVSTAWT
jgi:hypothetical protein